MHFTRTQVRAALEALDLEPDDVRTIMINTTTVYVELVARDENGEATFKHGIPGYSTPTIDIDEEAPDDGDS